MSNQTFIKKDRISFAVNLNEVLTIAPTNNNTTIYFGSSNLDSNVGVVLSNQYIYADGTYLSNLPTAITQTNVNSTLTGLATLGYISTSQLTSTVAGLGTSGNPATWANYPAINTVNVAGNIISNTDTILVNSISSATLGYTEFLNFVNFQNHDIYGVTNLQVDSFSANNYGNIRYDTSVNMNANEISNINAAYFGYTITTTYKDGLYMTEYTAPDSSVKSPALGLYANSIPFVGTSADNTLVNLYNVNSLWVSNINTSSISGDGSKLFNLNAISSTSLQSTVRGLGTIGYISSSQLISTVAGLGNINYLSTISSVQSTITSSIVGLGTLGYVSSSQLTSTIRGLGTLGYISSVSTIQPNITSTIIGLGTLGYISSAGASQTGLTSSIIGLGTVGYISSVSTFQPNITSSIIGLGTVGYVSSTQLQSTIRGLGTVGYISSVSTFQPNITSSIIGLGTVGYISSVSTIQPNITSSIIGLGTVGYISSVSTIQPNITSSIIGLGTVGYISSVSTIQPNITSSIIGLGTVGYISSTQLQSSIIGLGTVGYISSVSTIQPNITSSIIGLGTVGYISSVSTIQPNITSSIIGLGTVGYISSISTIQPNITSSIIGLGTVGYISSVSTIQPNITSSIIGLGTIGYISSVSTIQPNITSSIIGLGTVGYVSSTQLQSTVRGLGNIYLSTFNGSTTFLSSAVGFISSLNVNSLVFGTGQGWIDFGAVRTLILSSLQINTGVLIASSLQGDGSQIFNLNAISSLSLQSTVRGLGTVGYLSSFNSISSLNISSGNITTSTLRASFVSTNLIVGTVITQTLNPFSAGAQLGFGSNTSQNGFYGEGHFRSTFTQVIQPTLDNDGFSNVVRINGNISSQNIFVSSMTAQSISSFFYGGIEKYNYISTSALQSTITGLGTLGYISSAGGGLSQSNLTSSIIGLGTVGYVSTSQLFSSLSNWSYYPATSTLDLFNNSINNVDIIETHSISLSNIYSPYLYVNTSIDMLGTYNILAVNNITANNIYVGDISANNFIGDGSQIYNINAISTPSLQSTVRGLGTVGYVSTSQLFSSLSNWSYYPAKSTVDLSFNNIINVNNLTTYGVNTFLETFFNDSVYVTSNNLFTNGIGAYDLTYVTFINDINMAGYNISNINTITANNFIGDGSQIYNLNAISTLSLQSTITGLGTLGYISSAGGGLSQANLTSSIIGLGTVGYVSTSQLFSSLSNWSYYPAKSTVDLSFNNIINVNNLTTYGVNTFLETFFNDAVYVTSNNLFTNGIGAYDLTYVTFINDINMAGYNISNINTITANNIYAGDISANNFIGNGSQIYNLNAISTLSLQSTVRGLGTVGYVSSTQLQSTVRGLGNIYTSSLANWSQYPAIQDINVNSNNINNLLYLKFMNIPNSVSYYVKINSGSNNYKIEYTAYDIDDNIVINTRPIAQDWSYFKAEQNVDIDGNDISNINTITANNFIGDGSQIYNLNAISTLSLQSTITGLGTLGYISSAGGGLSQANLTSSIIGLGTVGYVSSTQLQSTVRGLGNIYISTFNGSTTFLSSAVGFISSLTVNSLTVGSGIGYVDFGAIRAVIVSSVQTNTGLLLASSITGDGSQIFNLNAISSLSLQSTVRGLGTIGYLSSFNSISSLNISSGNITTSTLRTSFLSTNLIVGTVITQTLNPFSAGAQLGFGSNTSQNGFYGEGHFRSTFTQVIQPTLDNDGFSNVVRINGNISSQIIFVSSMTAQSISSFFYGGIEKYNYISTTALQSTVFGLVDHIELNSSIIGLGTLGYLSSFNGSTNFLSSGNAFISSLTVTNLTFAPGTGWVNIVALQTVLTSSIQTDTAILNASSLRGDGSQIYNLNAISTLSLQSTITGLGTLGYISSAGSSQTGLTSSIIGLATVGYISSTQLQSTVRGLGSLGYLSSFNGSTNFLSTGNAFISSLTVTNLTFAPGTGWVNIVALQTVLTSSIQTDTGILNASSLRGDGSQIYNLNAVSTLSLQSTITGLGTLGYISSAGASQTGLTSSIIGLATVGYISSTQLQSTVRGLGTVGYVSSSTLQSSIIGLGSLGYLSSFNGSTNFLSSGNAFISSLTVTNLIFAPGTGWVNIVALQTVLTSSIQTDTGILNASSLRGDGSQIYNLNAVSTLSLQSTITGLGTLGYISSAGASQTGLTSSIIGLGTVGYVSSTQLQSTVRGLGTVGYVSSSTLQSSIIGLGSLGYLSSFNGSTNFLSSGNAFISSLTVTNLIFAPGTGWVNIVALQTVLTSSIQTDTAILNASSLRGDGSQIYNLNAVSTLSLQSTITGLGTLGYISSAGASQTGLTSSIIGLGTVGYVSSTQLQSTVRGLGTVGYISSSTLQSSIIGLATVGYISSTQLQSTVRGLGTIGYNSTLFNFSALTISTGTITLSSLRFYELTTNSTQAFFYKSTNLYFGNNIVVGALQYTPQYITF